MQEGTLVRWLKAEGALVRDGEAIAEIETDKAVVEFESYAAGVLSKILVTEGTTVPVGQVIAVIGAKGEAVDSAAAPQPAADPPPPAAITAPAAVEETDSAAVPLSSELGLGLTPPVRAALDGAAQATLDLLAKMVRDHQKGAEMELEGMPSAERKLAEIQRLDRQGGAA